MSKSIPKVAKSQKLVHSRIRHRAMQKTIGGTSKVRKSLRRGYKNIYTVGEQ